METILLTIIIPLLFVATIAFFIGKTAGKSITTILNDFYPKGNGAKNVIIGHTVAIIMGSVQ